MTAPAVTTPVATSPEAAQPGTARERLVRLRAEIGALHVGTDGSGGPRTTDHWSAGRRRLREAVLADDPAQLLTWPVIRDTMLVAGELHPYLAAELDVLQADPQWADRWRAASEEDPVGSPPPLPGHPTGSGNRLHHAYQFRLLEQAGAPGVHTYDGVVEFGAGYGAMCAVARRLGFAGRYLLFDLPEFSALQRWYLGELGVPEADGDGGAGAAFESREDELARVVGEASERDLFVAMWSLSETPLALRERLLPGGERFGGYLVGYQPQFESIDNVAWFADFRAARPEVEWSGGDPEPASGNRYLIGRRRS